MGNTILEIFAYFEATRSIQRRSWEHATLRAFNRKPLGKERHEETSWTSVKRPELDSKTYCPLIIDHQSTLSHVSRLLPSRHDPSTRQLERYGIANLSQWIGHQDEDQRKLFWDCHIVSQVARRQPACLHRKNTEWILYPLPTDTRELRGYIQYDNGLWIEETCRVKKCDEYLAWAAPTQIRVDSNLARTTREP